MANHGDYLHHQSGQEQAHDAAHHPAHHSVRDDRVPAFVALIGGAIFIFTVLFTVVRLTNAKFAGHGERPAAAATK
jgi:hypothetical protein